MKTYKVTVTASEADAVRVRLVEAKNRKGAIAHVAKDTITAEEATTPDLLDLGSKGVQLERAEPKA